MADTFEWNGPLILDKVVKAARQGADDTTADCVVDGKKGAPVVTATYQGSIRSWPAEADGTLITAEWGSADVDYALAIELGIRGRSPNRNHRGKNNLRNAADKNYPNYGDYVAKRYARL